MKWFKRLCALVIIYELSGFYLNALGVYHLDSMILMLKAFNLFVYTALLIEKKYD
jgi:hypothetical protein